MKTKTKRNRGLTLGFQCDQSLLDKVNKQASKYHVSKSDVLRWAVLEWLEKAEQREKVA